MLRTALTLATLAGVGWLIYRQETRMATAAQQIDALSTKFDDLASDVRAAVATLSAERENLTADGQAAVDRLSAKVAAFDTEIGDADGSDTATPGNDTPAEPEQPAV